MAVTGKHCEDIMKLAGYMFVFLLLAFAVALVGCEGDDDDTRADADQQNVDGANETNTPPVQVDSGGGNEQEGGGGGVSLCLTGTYNGLSTDGTQNVLPDETNDALLADCSQWPTRQTAGVPAVTVDAGTDDLQIGDSGHAVACSFARNAGALSPTGSVTTAALTAAFMVDAPSSATDFQGGTLGVFLEIDDGVSRLYVCLLNQDFAGGADPEVGIAGAGALNQYGTYTTGTCYWDDGAYHTFVLSRNNDGSATLVVDGDGAGAINVPAGSLQPTSGTPRFRFGAAAGGSSLSHWDSITYKLGP
jgi:hypothetical protein